MVNIYFYINYLFDFISGEQLQPNILAAGKTQKLTQALVDRSHLR